MILSQTDAMMEALRLLEQDAAAMRRYDPTDPKAQVLTRVVEDFRQLLANTTPTWVSVGAVQERTGWSRQAIRKRCKNLLQARQEARKALGGEWEVLMAAALQWPKRSVVEQAEGVTDIHELARLVGRAG